MKLTSWTHSKERTETQEYFMYIMLVSAILTLPKKCSHLEFFWSAFFRIRAKYVCIRNFSGPYCPVITGLTLRHRSHALPFANGYQNAGVKTNTFFRPFFKKLSYSYDVNMNADQLSSLKGDSSPRYRQKLDLVGLKDCSYRLPLDI